MLLLLRTFPLLSNMSLFAVSKPCLFKDSIFLRFFGRRKREGGRWGRNGKIGRKEKKTETRQEAISYSPGDFTTRKLHTTLRTPEFQLALLWQCKYPSPASICSHIENLKIVMVKIE